MVLARGRKRGASAGRGRLGGFHRGHPTDLGQRRGLGGGLESLLDGATASFRSDLKQQASALQKALKANKVDAEGEVVSAGVARSTDEQVTVYIAATGTVSNSGTKAPQQRGYRVKVEMRNVEGRWLVSGLEFIP